MSLAGGGGTGGGYGGAGGSGGGRDDKLKKKFDDTPLFAADEGNNEQEPVFPDLGPPEEDAGATAAASGAAAAAGTGSRVVEYRGVRRYPAGDGSHQTTYVSCINNRDSPHNNRQIWLGRYFDVRAAAMAYDVFCFFNHHETFVNFPELLHLYAQVVPRRAIQPDGSFVPITASDLERIKHIGLGIIRAFYPNSCAAIHTRRNQKALPAANPALTAQQRQNAAALQHAYHTQIEERTRDHVLGFIANQQPLAQQVGAGLQVSLSSAQASERIPNTTNVPLLAPSLNSAIQVPSSVSSQTSHAPAYGSHIDFSAIQVPHTHASMGHLASTTSPRAGKVRHAPTSPDTLRHATSRHIESSLPPSFAQSNPFARNFFAQFAPPSQTTWLPETYQSSPDMAVMQANDVGRPAPTRLVAPSDLSLLQAMGLIRDATTNALHEKLSSIVRSNMERGGPRDEGHGAGGSSGRDPYREAAEARLYAERLRAERLNREHASTGSTEASPFPLLSRLSELSNAPFDTPRLASPKKQRSSEPTLGTYADIISPSRPAGHGLQSRSSAFATYKATDIIQGILTSPVHLPDDHDQPEENQRVVPLSRRTPEEVPLFSTFKQGSAAAETTASTTAFPTNPSTSNIEGSSPTFSPHVRSSEQEGTTTNRPISTELTLAARGQLGEPSFVRAPLVPDLNIRAPSEESSEVIMQEVSTTSADQGPQGLLAPIDITELQRLSTLGPSWQADPSLVEQDKSKQEEDKGKGKEKAED